MRTSTVGLTSGGNAVFFFLASFASSDSIFCTFACIQRMRGAALSSSMQSAHSTVESSQISAESGWARSSSVSMT
ncbi:hypothetical protein WT08_23890 [Burkholderia sp. MSMB1552]|nr:hypothetical protein WS76_24585 [Burkholderia humptydooensis]KVN03169.1 hypothetical protein WT08_23890 [Burkholderia sp. MSMB1552]KWZ49828.1 hypothetical protein WS92_20370 [Burkholderia sp. MSMB1588]